MQQRLVILFLAALLAGCSEPPGGSAQADGKVFRYALGSAPTSLDPVRASTLYANQLVENLYETLYVYKYLARPFELRTQLAAGMPEVSDDGLTYTIRLQPGRYFADSPAFPDGKGREITAADFVFSLKRHFDPATRPQGAWLWQGRVAGIDAWKDNGSDYAAPVEGLQAIDRYTVRIRLVRPYPQLVYTLATGFSAVVPREAIDYYGREFSINPVGSGPFRLVAYDGTKAVLERNPSYRSEPIDLAAEGYDPETQAGFGLELIDGRTPPLVDRVEVSFIKESSALWSSFTKGNEVQMASLPSEQVYRVMASVQPPELKPEYAEKYFMKASREAGFVYVTFNMDFPEIGYHPDPERNERNQALRCALVKAFDWEARNNSWYANLGEVFPGIIPPAVPEFDPDLSRDSVTHDPEGARQLLADYGWNADNLPELVYGSTPGPTLRLFFEQFRGWLTAIGYPREKVVLQTYATFGDLMKAVSNSELPLSSKGWGLDFPDAQNTLQLFYGPNRSPGSNDANYNNPVYDELYRQAAVMQSSPERTAIYRRMNEMVIDDCVAIAGLSRKAIGLWHRNVVAYPQKSFIGGRFLQFVDVLDAELPWQAPEGAR